MWIIITLAIIISIIMIAIGLTYNKSSSSSTFSKQNKKPKELSYKQQMYINALKGDETSPYFGATYNISQSAYDAFSDFIEEVFGYTKGTKESEYKISLMIKKGLVKYGTFRVLPDGDKDLTFPRASTDFLNRSRDMAMKEFMRVDDTHFMFFFNDCGSNLSKLLKQYFKKTNIEYKYISRIKPFSSKTNCCVLLDVNSEETAMVYYLVRFYSKDRTTVGLKRPEYPSQRTMNQYRIKIMKKYNLKNEYEFMRYLISFFVPCELIAKTFFAIRPNKIQEIRDVANNNPGNDRTVLRHYRDIEKELLKELKNEHK